VILARTRPNRHDATQAGAWARAWGALARDREPCRPASAVPTEGIRHAQGIQELRDARQHRRGGGGLRRGPRVSALIAQFIKYIINPLLAATVSGRKLGLGWLLRPGNPRTFVNVGGLIGAVINFAIFMLVIYLAIVVPYKAVQKRRGQDVYGPPEPVKTCPACLSTDLPEAAATCKYCGTEQPGAAAAV
jgi:large conductance mechanosensitive channel